MKTLALAKSPELLKVLANTDLNYREEGAAVVITCDNPSATFYSLREVVDVRILLKGEN